MEAACRSPTVTRTMVYCSTTVHHRVPSGEASRCFSDVRIRCQEGTSVAAAHISSRKQSEARVKSDVREFSAGTERRRPTE